MSSSLQVETGRVPAPVVAVQRWVEGRTETGEDAVVAEEPLQVLLNGLPLTVVVRTPGQDVDLALGLLHNEAFLRSIDDVASLALSASAAGNAPDGLPVELLPLEENVVDVRLRRTLNLASAGWQRHLLSASGCGVCGASTLQALEKAWPVVAAEAVISSDVLAGLPASLRQAQSLFTATGGVHAAGLFTLDGRLLRAAEDVGRHNAVDKLVGRALLERRLPLSDCCLLLSGRAGFELVQKAAAAGVPIVASVSAASSLAVQTALRFGITLAGFVRDGRMTVYSAPERIRRRDQ
jgi:FdhD protein